MKNLCVKFEIKTIFMKKIYSVRLTKIYFFVCMMALLAGARLGANAQSHSSVPKGSAYTTVQNHTGQITANRNITAPDGRQLAFSVSGRMPAGASVNATPVQRTAPPRQAALRCIRHHHNQGRSAVAAPSGTTCNGHHH